MEVVGDAGVLVNPLSEEDLTAAIDRVFRDPELQQTLGKRALERAARFGWDHSARQLLQVFTKAVENRAR